MGGGFGFPAWLDNLLTWLCVCGFFLFPLLLVLGLEFEKWLKKRAEEEGRQRRREAEMSEQELAQLEIVRNIAEHGYRRWLEEQWWYQVWRWLVRRWQWFINLFRRKK